MEERDLNSEHAQVIQKLREENPEVDRLMKALVPVTETVSLYDAPINLFYVGTYVLAEEFIPNYILFQNFKVRESDVYVSTFPKTGTTWSQEITYLITNGFDFEKAESTTLDHRFPFLDYVMNDIKSFDDDPNPRLFKTHLAFSMMPRTIFDKKCKVIYVARNPKDTIVSLYHFLKNVNDAAFNGSINDLVDSFLNNQVMYCPFADHVLEAWDRRNEENILFLFYEDLKEDLPREIRRVADFLGKECTDEQVEKLASHCSFKNMARNNATNMSHWKEPGYIVKEEFTFMRKGTVGDWKNHFDENTNQKVDKWIEEKFGGSDIKFKYEL